MTDLKQDDWGFTGGAMLETGAVSDLLKFEKKNPAFSGETDRSRKSQFGQFFTPASIARFMVELFPVAQNDECRLLDPGAGVGALVEAFLEECVTRNSKFKGISVTAYELDSGFHVELADAISKYADALPVSFRILGEDFIEAAVRNIFSGKRDLFTHAILNPPYRKIHNGSRDRLLLRKVGIETVNLYSAFVALTIELMSPGGWIAAIIPRSFCNGPYYRTFRKFLLDRAAIRRLHLFDARDRIFNEEKVLQENVILVLERAGCQEEVIVSTSTDASFGDLKTRIFDFNQIVSPTDSENFIRIPTSSVQANIDFPKTVQHSLDEIGIQVSTGPVVDFRLKEHLREAPDSGTIPLFYPTHFSKMKTRWPNTGGKKPNAILRNRETEKWLYPNGYYVVVRRLSSKEEARRIVAAVVDPDEFPQAEVIGFENHLNVFHQKKTGLPKKLAQGLAVFLNSTAVDQVFRRFNGLTQVNATDLRKLHYPGREALAALGEWAMRQTSLTQSMIDEKLEEI